MQLKGRDRNQAIASFNQLPVMVQAWQTMDHRLLSKNNRHYFTHRKY